MNQIDEYIQGFPAEVQEILKTQGWGRKSPKRVPKLGKSIEDQIDAEKRAEETETNDEK